MKENDDEIRLQKSKIDSLNKEVDRLRQLLQMQQLDAGINGHSSSVREVRKYSVYEDTKPYRNYSMCNDTIHEYHI